MKLRIGSRKSDLARLMAAHVGAALTTAHPHLEIEYVLKTSEGDRDRVTPLWELSDKGAFTRDLSLQLQDGAIDLAVHSWKDLPLETDLPTVIAGTLPRADSRDVFFVPSERWPQCAASGRLKVLSSSPRRAYNLDPFLRNALPAEFSEISFESVRGNIPSRVRKLLDGEGDALVVAKAALDRLLAEAAPEYAAARRSALDLLTACRWMITPLSENPCAPAQGAIAIEAARNRSDVHELVAAINCVSTFREVTREREILGRYGGGCHQKIGVAVLEREFGTVTFLRGLTDQGEVLNQRSLESSLPTPPKTECSRIWPMRLNDASFFDRRELPCPMPDAEHAAFWISKADALPVQWAVPSETLLWAAGTESWRKLARRGLWVNGCSDSLGESEPRYLEHFVSSPLTWYKLSHREAPSCDMIPLSTYELVERDVPSALREKTHFFWKSASQCAAALKRYPEIRERWHACGPGNSYRLIRELLGEGNRLSVAIGFEEWKDEVVDLS